MASAIPSAIDPATLTRLREESRSNPGDALNSAASQFEALFLQMMLKSMRAGTPGGGIMDSKQVEFYREMFDQQLAVALSEAGTLGIAEAVAGQLGGHHPEKAAVSQDAVQALERRRIEPAAARLNASTAISAAASATASISQNVDSAHSPAQIEGPESFLSAVWGPAKTAAQHLGVPPQVLVAQAALETAWGRSVPQQADGNSSYNLFGIKAHPGWQGQRAVASTLEFGEAGAQRIRAAFRAYDSIEASFRDYARLISEDPRYAAAMESGGDPGRYLEALQQGGYATDPDYAAKIRAVIESNTMKAALEKLKV